MINKAISNMEGDTINGETAFKLFDTYGFPIELTEELCKEKSIEVDIEGFKDYTLSTNLYKFRYDSLDKIKEIYELMKKDNKDFFLDFRKADFRYEFGVYDEDNNMILVTKATED